ncbi:MAG: lipopolysaccharide biosynthesis protein RfbH [Candidatus Omnitrophica bacterium]|nr:lipopolysaccharide biosynthesis protein RfbH [Candidatus Omnitrophota bacterium]
MKYKGKIFKIPFPFTNLKGKKVRPALAVSEPDEYGDMEFLFITTKETRGFDRTLDIPAGLLPFESILHVEKRYLLNKSIIMDEMAEVDKDFLAKVLKEITFNDTVNYYLTIHKPNQYSEFVPSKSKISYAGRIFDEKEMINLVDSSLDFWLTTGKYTERFEKEFAEFLGVKYCSLTNSGSSANLIAFMTLTSPKLGERRIKKGDEVITVAAGFPTTVAPIIQYGAIPVFVDITLPTYNIDCSQLKTALSDKTKAVMLAHTLGNPFDIKAVKDFCDTHNLWFIEDNCDALGSSYIYNGEWRYTGTFGDIATSSFYPPHHMTMGEGGAVYTNDVQLKRIVDSFRDWGRDCWCPSGHDDTCKKRFDWQLGELPYGYDHKYVYSHFGYNLKVTDMQAAIGCAQLGKLPSFIEARKKNWKLLRDGLSNLPDRFILPEPTPNSDPSWFGFLLTVRENAGFTRDEMVNNLETNGIQTRMLFAGNLIKHPCFDEMRKNGQGFRIVNPPSHHHTFSSSQLLNFSTSALPNTDRVMRDTFWIGVYPGIREEMLSYIAEKIRDFVKGRVQNG